MPSLNLHRFDLLSLRLFVAVTSAGSLTAGAERIGISLAAASKRIAELESHIGVPLLARSKRGTQPTAAGETLQRHAIEIVARLEQLAVAMADYERGTRAHLRLWANTSAFSGFLPRLLGEFSAAYPLTKIDLEDAHSDDAARAVLNGSAELAVIGENTPSVGLQTIVCDCDELVLAMPIGHPLAGLATLPLGRVLDHDFVALGRSTSLTRQISAAADAIGRALRIRVQVRSFDAMCRMVASGLGIAILPRAGAAPHVTSMGLQLARIESMPTERRLLLAMRDRGALSAPARALVEMVEARDPGVLRATPPSGG